MTIAEGSSFYLVTIPESVTINGTAEIKAEKVNLAADETLYVTLTEQNPMKTQEGAQLNYTITNGDDVTIGVNDTVLEVAGGTVDNSDSVTLAFTNNDVAQYSGDYIGTVTFTVSVQ